jgi:nicotinamidase/pyrazinamidase
LLARALLLVDMSNDFIRLDGALNCGQPGMDIVPYCRQLVASFLETGDFVLDARDLHDLTDYEIASGMFPPHNLRETSGQELISELKDLLAEKPNQWLYIPKKHYNAGYGTNLFALIQEKSITEIHVVGVCTDICVRYTVNGLHEFKTSVYPELQIVVHKPGVASFNEGGHKESLAHFTTALGTSVVESSKVEMKK